MQRFQSRGTLREDSFYAERGADAELESALSGGEYCYVLAPRQVGKSSLRVRTQRRLGQHGIRCVVIDLNSIGSMEEPERWYFGLVDHIARSLDLQGDPQEFWEQRVAISPLQRWMRYLHEQVLRLVPEPIVLFIDEIDVLLSARTGRDDFLTAIRSCYNLRAQDPTYGRLTFCLLGVATPSELMADPRRTPLNVGRWVELSDLTPDEAAVLLPGLAPVSMDPAKVMRAILNWTGGHPAMTQRVCERLSAAGLIPAGAEEDRVAAVVAELFLDRGRLSDPILIDVERRFEHTQLAALVSKMLSLYRATLIAGAVTVEREQPVHIGLRIAGLVTLRTDGTGATLTARNRITASVFDLQWIKQKQAARLLSEPLQRWLESERNDDYVLRGEALAAAVDWLQGRDDLSDEERDFMLAGEHVAEQERAAEARRTQAEETALRRQQLLLRLGLLLALLCATGGMRWLLSREQRSAWLRERQAGEEELAVRLALSQDPQAWQRQLRDAQQRVGQLEMSLAAERAVLADRQHVLANTTAAIKEATAQVEQLEKEKDQENSKYHQAQAKVDSREREHRKRHACLAAGRKDCPGGNAISDWFKDINQPESAWARLRSRPYGAGRITWEEILGAEQRLDLKPAAPAVTTKKPATSVVPTTKPAGSDFGASPEVPR